MKLTFVLSAIRRGEDSLPKLRAATGLEYAQLHVELHKLEFEDRAIQRNENADGFDRYVPMPAERVRTSSIESTVHTIAPAALARTNAAQTAREMALLQRNAPYCVGCRAVCILVISLEGRVRWRCRPCNAIFDGSTESVLVARIPTEAGPKITVMRERDTLGEDEERALANMRVPVDHQIGLDEEAALDEMRGGELDENEARIAEEIDAELAELENEEPDVAPAIAEKTCGCGRDASHQGRCRARREKEKARATARRAGKQSLLNGRPRIDVDLKRFEDLLANPTLALCDVYESAGMKRNLVYYRRDHDPVFRDAYLRGLERRLRASQDGQAWNSGENIAETITEQGQVVENRRNVQFCNFSTGGSINGTSDGTETAQQERAQEVRSDISEDKNLSIAGNSPINEKPKTGNGYEPTAETLLKMIADKESQIHVLQDDIVALKRVANILSR